MTSREAFAMTSPDLHDGMWRHKDLRIAAAVKTTETGTLLSFSNLVIAD